MEVFLPLQVLVPAPAQTREKTEQGLLNVLIVGSGAVGKATGVGLKQLGLSVRFHDKSPEALKELKKQGLTVSNALAENFSESDVVLICVPTPTVNGHQDISYVLESAGNIGEALRNDDQYRLVVVRSTVLPGTTRNQIIPVIERTSGKRAGEDFGVCANPEFLRAASAIDDFLNSSRIVIGESDPRAGDLLAQLYERLRCPVVRCSLEEAELIKYVSNAFLASKISFFNEIYKISKKLGLDDKVVSYGASLDERIGGYGVKGGSRFDGPCLPKDLDALITFVKGIGADSRVLEAVALVNREMDDVQ